MTDIDDLIFLNRNKIYGAYRLRKLYSRNMSIGLGISILLFLIFIIVPSIHWDGDEAIYKMTEVVLETPPEMSVPMLKQSAPKPAAQESEIKAKAENKIKTGDKPRIVKENQVEPIKTEVTEMMDTSQKESSKNPILQDSFKGKGTTEGEGDLPFDFVDVMPQFPGGQRSLSRFISSKLVYPGSALQNKIEGIVIIGFIIDKNGRLSNPKILKSLYPACDNEALRVVRLIPDWIPAKNQGRNVSINYRMPIEFKLTR